MNFLLYKSTCVIDPYRSYDLAILRTALHNNRLHGLTGFLHRNKTHFFQYIEGGGQKLAQLTENLRLDHRHNAFQPLRTGTIQHRRFPEWSMGYTDGLAEIDDFGTASGEALSDLILDFLLEVSARQRASIAKSASHGQV